MRQTIKYHTFENGLILVAECMPWLKSAAFAFLVPGGCQSDPSDKIGLANFTCEMVQRGSGERSSRQFVEDLEELGADCSSSVSNAHSNYSGVMPASAINETLSIYADVIRRPHLPADQIEEARMVCLQEISALEDDLSQMAMVELRRVHYPDPFGRTCYGSVKSIESITPDDIQRFAAEVYRPNDMVISVAGNVDWEDLIKHVDGIFGDWPSREIAPLKVVDPPGGVCHIPQESNQTHIGLAYPSVPYAHNDYFRARGIVGVLSDGMSSRLFTEVREKRGLCYTVFASQHSTKDHGSVICYSGTSSERAQETLDVIVSELRRLGEGIETAELDRLKVQIRSGLVMQQESSRSRASSIAGDWYHLGRVRSLDEVSALINALTVDELVDYIRRNPLEKFDLVTLGPQPLDPQSHEESRGVSAPSA